MLTMIPPPTTFALPVLDLASERKPDTVALLPLSEYDVIIVSFSGGKDSLACLLHLLELGVPREKIQLWHQSVDGAEDAPGFMDWASTPAYCRAVASALGVRILFQYRIGGFLGEMLKEDSRSLPVRFERQDGTWAQAGGLKGKVSTRRRYPQATANLAVRWCSAALKIDVAALALNNEPSLKRAKVLFVTGERRQESTARSKYAEKEPHRCHTRSRLVHAWRNVIDWSEQDVWAILQRWRMVPHPAYRLGWGRLSCQACIFGGANQWASIRKIAPVTFDVIASYEQEFGCTIKQGKNVVQLADQGTPYPGCDNQALVALALGRDYPTDQVRLPEGATWELPAGAFSACGGPT